MRSVIEAIEQEEQLQRRHHVADAHGDGDEVPGVSAQNGESSKAKPKRAAQTTDKTKTRPKKATKTRKNSGE